MNIGRGFTIFQWWNVGPWALLFIMVIVFLLFCPHPTASRLSLSLYLFVFLTNQKDIIIIIIHLIQKKIRKRDFKGRCIFLLASVGPWPPPTCHPLVASHYTCRSVDAPNSSSHHCQLPTFLPCTRSYSPSHLTFILTPWSTTLTSHYLKDHSALTF